MKPTFSMSLTLLSKSFIQPLNPSNFVSKSCLQNKNCIIRLAIFLQDAKTLHRKRYSFIKLNRFFYLSISLSDSKLTCCCPTSPSFITFSFKSWKRVFTKLDPSNASPWHKSSDALLTLARSACLVRISRFRI